LKKEWIDAATKLFQKSGETAILIGSFTPIPFKVFTILSGALRFPLWKLIAYAAFGRAVKFYVVGILFYMYGKAAAHMAKDVSLYVFLAAIPLLIIFMYYKKRKAKKASEASEAESAEKDKDVEPEKQSSNG
jgi:membrane protein DedA with SNARE-associated domain